MFSLPFDYSTVVNLWNDFVTLGMKAESLSNRIDYVAMSVLLLTLIPLISSGEGTFYLKPPYFSTSNIFIDAEFNITSIIDWT